MAFNLGAGTSQADPILTVPGVVALSGTLPNAQALAGAAQITYITDHGPSHRHAETRSSVGAPTPLDVDGDAVPDATALLALAPGDPIVATLRVDRTAGATAKLPAAIQVRVSDPSNAAVVYTFGLDGRADKVPTTFQAAITPRAGGVDATVTTSGAGTRLDVLANVASTKPIDVRAGLSPVPGKLTASVMSKEGATKELDAAVTVDVPTKVDLGLTSVEGGERTVLTGVLDRIDAGVTVGFDQRKLSEDEDAIVVDTTSTGARIAKADIEVRQTAVADGKLLSHTKLRAEGLPSTTKTTYTPDPASDRIKADFTGVPGQSIDLVEFQAADGTAHTLGSDDGDLVDEPRYAYVFTDGAVTTTLLRLTGLESAHVDLGGEKHTIDSTMEAGRFRAYVDKDGLLDVRAFGLPREVDLEVAPKGAPTIDFHGSAGVDRIVVERHDPKGIGRSSKTCSGPEDEPPAPAGCMVATRLGVSVEDLPDDVEATVKPAGGGVALETKDSPAIGRVTVALGNEVADAEASMYGVPMSASEKGWMDGVAARGNDGVRVLDVDGRYLVMARLQSLDEAHVTLTDKPDVRVVRTTPHDIELLIVGKVVGAPAPRSTPTESITGKLTGTPVCLRFAIAEAMPALTCSADVAADEGTPPVDGARKPSVLLFEGSAPTGGVQLVASRLKDTPDKDLHVGLTGVPRRLRTVVYGERGVEVEADGGQLGAAEFRQTTGPVDDQLPAGEDGLLVKDKLVRTARDTYVRERNVLLARLTAVSHVRFSRPGIVADFRADVDATGGRPFRVHMENDEIPIPGHRCTPGTDQCEDYPPRVKSLTARASSLQPKTVLFLDTSTGATKLDYRAAGEIGRLDLDTNMTGSELTVDADNVAKKFHFCIHPGSAGAGLGGDTHACGVNGMPEGVPGLGNGPTMLATADAPQNPQAPMTVDVLNCVRRDADGRCGPDVDPAEYIKVIGLRIRKVAFRTHTMPSTDTYIHVDTDDHQAFGDITVRLPYDAKPDKVFARMRGVRAENRRVLVATALAGLGAPVQAEGSARGTIHCTEEFDVWAVDNSFIGSLKLPLCFNPVAPMP